MQISSLLRNPSAVSSNGIPLPLSVENLTLCTHLHDNTTFVPHIYIVILQKPRKISDMHTRVKRLTVLSAS